MSRRQRPGRRSAQPRGPSFLSLTEVAAEGPAGAEALGRRVGRLAFAIDGSPLVVAVVEDAALGGSGGLT